MTIEIKHNQSFWEQGPQNAEEIHATQQLQTGLYTIRKDTHIGITWEEHEQDTVFVLYLLDGEMQFQSSRETFILKKTTAHCSPMKNLLSTVYPEHRQS